MSDSVDKGEVLLWALLLIAAIIARWGLGR